MTIRSEFKHPGVMMQNVRLLFEEFEREASALLGVLNMTRAKCPECGEYLARDFSCPSCGFAYRGTSCLK